MRARIGKSVTQSKELLTECCTSLRSALVEAEDFESESRVSKIGRVAPFCSLASPTHRTFSPPLMSDNTFLASMGIDFSEEGASDLTALLAANSTWLAPPHPSAGPGYSSPAQQQQQPSNSCNNPFLHPEHQKAMTDLNIALTQVASLSVANSNLTTRAVTAEAKVMELARRLQHGESESIPSGRPPFSAPELNCLCLTEAAVTTPGASRSSKQRTRPSPLPPYEPIDPTIRAKYQPDVDRLNRLPPSATSITEPYSAAGTVKLGGLYSALKEKPLSITAAQTKTMGESRCALVNDLLDIGRTWEQQNSEDVEFAIKVLEYRVVPLQYCPSTAEVEQASDSATAARTGSWMARLLLQKELENRRVGFTKRNEVPVKVKTEPGLENEAPSLKHPRSDTEDDSPPRQGPSSKVLGNHTAPVSIPTKVGLSSASRRKFEELTFSHLSLADPRPRARPLCTSYFPATSSPRFSIPGSPIIAVSAAVRSLDISLLFTFPALVTISYGVPRSTPP